MPRHNDNKNSSSRYWCCSMHSCFNRQHGITPLHWPCTLLMMQASASCTTPSPSSFPPNPPTHTRTRTHTRLPAALAGSGYDARWHTQRAATSGTTRSTLPHPQQPQQCHTAPTVCASMCARVPAAVCGRAVTSAAAAAAVWRCRGGGGQEQQPWRRRLPRKRR